jgi:SPASM domain peptide maturase of grasp-with-spasm system
MLENSIVYLHFNKENRLSCSISDTLIQIEKLGCKALVLIVDNHEPNIVILKEIEELISLCNISYLEIIFQSDCIKCSKEDIFSLFMRQFGLVSVKFFNSSENKVINFIYEGQVFTNRKVEYYTQPFNNQNCCGLVIPFEFNLQFPHYLESQHHNTCLNRKIAIDTEGNIKNCPSMAKSYGNIRDTKLIDVVNNPEFQKVWHIKKDEITKCKDCEFRHICTDCRAYLENPEDMYSAPLKCGYDPYTCTWEEWSTNPLKEKAIAYYGMEELVKK